MSTLIEASPTESTAPLRKPLYSSLWVQVLIAMVIAGVLGYVSPARAIAMKPLGDAFIRMISTIITVLIFCTVVTGIAGMQTGRRYREPDSPGYHGHPSQPQRYAGRGYLPVGAACLGCQFDLVAGG
ncbi:MAG: cation:dicarboxylase symporter family transporter [Candidatus Sulfotelmatobacter sp.]